MIPQAGSAYAYSYATLGELVAWIIGWDLILEYAVGNVAVAISWGDYFKSLVGDWISIPVWLTTGYRTALLSSDPQIHGLLDVGAAHRRHPDPDQRAGVRDRHADHLAAAARRAGERAREQHHGRGEADRARALHRRGHAAHQHRELSSRSRPTDSRASTRARRSCSSPTSGSTRSRRRPRKRRTRSATCRSAFSAGWRSAR